MDRIGLDEVLSSRNVDGRIYSCDIHRWLGVELPFKEREQVRDKLEELRLTSSYSQR